MKPKFITFTGADDQTSIDGMCELSAQYPIEWGVLFSPKRQGEGRYPSVPIIKEMVKRIYQSPAPLFSMSAHLCGADARDVLERGSSQHDELIATWFSRAQINTTSVVDTRAIAYWGESLIVQPIVQCRDQFPNDANVEWLFDASGGRGIAPAAWPDSRGVALRGYAGGLNPANVAAAVAQIGEMTEYYWIDMETGVRTDDRFDLDLCRKVCEAVYGTAKEATT